jgi:hypothetical protein
VSVFPNVTGELYLGPSLGWVDISADLRGRPAGSGGGVTITRGRPAEGQDVQVTRCELVLNNAGGKYSPRNPASPYYGLLGRNTPIRVRVAEADQGGAVALTGPAPSPATVTTPPNAALNGTGDVDVRVWARIPNWADGDGFTLAGRYVAAGTDRAWFLSLNGQGQPAFSWSPDGTLAARVDRTCGASVVPAADGSLAVRAALTVATGVVRFYTAPTMAGPWTQLGADSSPAGATSVAVAAGAGIDLAYEPSISSPATAGELYGFQLHTGGTLVASPDFTTLRAGATSLTDGQGRVWTLSPSAVAIDRGARFHGEVSSWPARWAGAGSDQWTPIEASGPFRRLSQGASPVMSPLRRTLTRLTPAGYLPLEDGPDTYRPTSAAPGVGAGTANQVEFGQESGRLAGTAAAAKMTAATSSITMPVGSRTLSSFWSLIGFFKLATAPVGADQTFMRVFVAGGLVVRWEFQLSGGGYRWIGYDKSGTAVADQAISSASQPPTDWVMWYFEVEQVAGTVSWRPWVANAGDLLFTAPGPFTFSGAIGFPTRVDLLSNSYFVDALWSHLAVDDRRIFLSDDFAKVSTGYTGETAGTRMARVAADEGMPITFWGAAASTQVMGPQPIAPLLDVLKDAAEVDGGILIEARGHPGLHYRTGASLTNQQGLPLDYGTHLSAPFEPVDDDDATRNDVTVSRPGGGSAQAVQDSGPLSVLAPPTGVGRYATSETVNVASDDALPDQAGWRLRLGTVDEARYPRIGLNLMRDPLRGNAPMLRAVTQVDAGDVASIAGLPSWLPPGPARVMVQGYTEMLDAYEWTIVWNAAPASPWDVAVVDGEARVAADGSTLALALPAAATSLALTSTEENGTWTEDPADFPLPMRVGAEQVTASAIGPAVSAAFTSTVAGGWPTAETGQTWTTSPSGDHSSASGVGRQSHGTVNSFRSALLDTGLTDLTTTVDVTIPVMPSGAPITHWSVARAVDLSNYYTVRLTVSPTGAVSLALLRRTGGTLSGSLAAAFLSSTHAAGNTWRVVLDVRGSTLRAKAWRPAVDIVPGWQVEATDGSLTAGTLAGPLSRLESGNTNTLPVVFSHDNWAVSNPQTVTLTARAVNGVSRSWPAGTGVDVLLPAVLSL